MKFAKEIAALESAARHTSGCSLTAPTHGSALGLTAAELERHAEVLRGVSDPNSYEGRHGWAATYTADELERAVARALTAAGSV